MPKKPDHRLIDISKLSRATRALNPHLTAGMPVEQRGTAVEQCRTKKTGSLSKDGPEPNKTEARFKAYWERLHHPCKLDFSPLTLRIGRRRYTPDWVFFEDQGILLIEVKGPWIEDDAKLKYDLFKTHYNGRFAFQMWQETDRLWTLIR